MSGVQFPSFSSSAFIFLQMGVAVLFWKTMRSPGTTTVISVPGVGGTDQRKFASMRAAAARAFLEAQNARSPFPAPPWEGSIPTPLSRTPQSEIHVFLELDVQFRFACECL